MKQKWEEKKTSLGNAIIISVVLTIIGFVFGYNFDSWFGKFLPYLSVGSSRSQKSDIDWSPLNEVYNQLAQAYDGEIDKNALIEGAKKGLTESLGDIYTVYMDSEEAAAFNDSLHGNVGSGVGIEMGLRDGYVRVLRTLPDNPAQKAGVLAGDIIYKVNGEEVYALSSEEIANKIRGETGTEVTVTMVRNGEELSFTMRREAINNVSAYIEYDGQTAIITASRFDNDTGTLIQGFAKEAKDKGVNKVILDLRNNGGGYVSAAQDLLGLWINGEVVLNQKSKHLGNSSTNAVAGKSILSDVKTVVLVNGSTASASEIVAGALQDYNKATVIGETTYGKGVVQTLYELSGSSMLKVTTASWYTPLDRSINKVGITPDVEVVRTYDDINAMRDPQMDAAKAL